jgi:HAD superfamily hydrolase (TIGR01549 family)
MPTGRGYDAVLFDMDGVLVEFMPTERKRAAVETALAAVDVDPTDEELAALLDASRAAREVCPRYGREPAAFFEAYDAESRRRQLDGLPEIKPAYDDAAVLRDLSATVGVASNNYQAVVDAVLDRDGLGEVVATAHGTDHRPGGRAARKPAPTLLDRALGDLRVERDRTLFVGDSAVDVAAADAAGVDAAYLDRSGDRPEREPTHRIENLRALPDLVE